MNNKGLGLFLEGIQHAPPALPTLDGPIPNHSCVIERELAPGTVLKRRWVSPGEVQLSPQPREVNPAAVWALGRDAGPPGFEQGLPDSRPSAPNHDVISLPDSILGLSSLTLFRTKTNSDNCGCLW